MTFSLIYIVTRSQTRVLKANEEKFKRYNIRQCHVRLDLHPETEALAWLKRSERLKRVAVVPSNPTPESAGPSLQHFQPAPISVHRRASVASGRNLFEVNGSIAEVGFDHLQRLQKNGPSNQRFFFHFFIQLNTK